MIGRKLRGVKGAKFEAYQVPYLANQRLADFEHIITPQDVHVPSFLLHRGACGRQSVHSFLLLSHLLVPLFFVLYHLLGAWGFSAVHKYPIATRSIVAFNFRI